jgi:NTP pyrophosphatase (non-canonical NTP hydrolase)
MPDPREEQERALSFKSLNSANVARARRWHPGFPEQDDWNGADWSNAMCGEAGEAANVVKKLRRIETNKVGTPDSELWGLQKALAKELADTVIYADLLAAKYGINLGTAIVNKFNEVSERNDFPERLGGS